MIKSYQNVSPAFAAAMVAAQGSIEGAIKGKRNPGFNAKYADLTACWDACREALQANQLAVIQFPAKAPEGFVGLRTCLVYGPTGEMLSEVFQMPLKDPRNAQALGSSITYARRYALCSVIGICPEDDDGNKAVESPKEPVQKPQTFIPEAELADLVKRFSEANTWEVKKEFFLQLKGAAVQEPKKTELLTAWGNEIKTLKAAEKDKKNG